MLDNLDKLKNLIKTYNNKKLYEIKAPKCPFDEMIMGRLTYFNTYSYLLIKIIETAEECCICMVYNNSFKNQCNHKVICSHCSKKIKKCPQCTADIIT